MSVLHIVAIAAIVIVIGLSAYAVHLLLQVRRQQQKQTKADAELKALAAEKRDKANKSIQILAHSLKEDERLTYTEACMRIRHLLDSLGIDEATQKEFSAVYQLADATAHIPILQDWKKLSRKQQHAYDKERLQLEQRYQDFIDDAVERLRGREF